MDKEQKTIFKAVSIVGSGKGKYKKTTLIFF